MKLRRRTTMQMQLCLRLPTLAASWLCRTLRHRSRDGRDPAILVVRLDGLGDCVLTLPLLDALRRRYPAARISILASPASAALFEAQLSVDEVLSMRTVRLEALPRQARTLFAALLTWGTILRRRRFDIVVNPRWDLDVYMATFLCALTRAPLTAGFEDSTTALKARLNRGFEKTWNLVVPAGPPRHEALRSLAMAQALDCECDQADAPRLHIPSTQRQQADAWLGERKGRLLGERDDTLLIALGLPAAEAQRRWPVDCYIALLRLLEHRCSVLPILLADEATSDDARKIAEAFPSARIAMRLPLPLITAILEHCPLFVGSDSGLGHAAAAAGCATVTLSPHPLNGDPAHPNSPIRFRPYSPKAVVLQPQSSHPGCESACISAESHCIANITPEEVAAAATQLLRSRRPLSEPRAEVSCVAC